jgi:hypothetical protein
MYATRFLGRFLGNLIAKWVERATLDDAPRHRPPLEEQVRELHEIRDMPKHRLIAMDDDL